MPTEKERKLSFDAPLAGIRQVTTCLTTYLHPIWRSEADEYGCEYAILDVTGNTLEPANLPMWDAYDLKADDIFYVVLLPELKQVK